MYTQAQFWYASGVALILGYLIRWGQQAAVNEARHQLSRLGWIKPQSVKDDEDVTRILAGFEMTEKIPVTTFIKDHVRGFIEESRPRSPEIIFGQVTKPIYIPRHAATSATHARVLNESTAAVPTVLPRRIPGEQLILEPVPEPGQELEVFSMAGW